MFKTSVVEVAAHSCGLNVVGACQGSNWRTEAVKLKKQAFGSWLAQGSLESADRYWTARRAAAWAVVEAKARVWEEFGETVDKDYRTSSKKFWQTIR